jgi:hypothetical protein
MQTTIDIDARATLSLLVALVLVLPSSTQNDHPPSMPLTSANHRIVELDMTLIDGVELPEKF